MGNNIPSDEIMTKSILDTLRENFTEENIKRDQEYYESNKQAFINLQENDRSMIESQFLSEFDYMIDSLSNDNIQIKKYYGQDDWFSLLDSNIYRNKNKTIQALSKFDIVITYGWNGVNYGPVSAWYDAFELWFMLQSNTLPTDLGGRFIALLFPDCPDQFSIIQILKSIFYKYTIDENTFISLCKSIFFINQPDKLELTIGELPYKNYSPSNLVFVDGVLPTIPIIADNIFVQTLAGIKEESLSKYIYNFLLIYTDHRMYTINDENKKNNLDKDLTIARAKLPNTIVYDDIRRVNFNSFRKDIEPVKVKEELLDDDSSQPLPVKRRFLLYVTPKNRSIYKTFDYKNGAQWSIQELDDILNTIPDQNLNSLAIELKNLQKDLFNYFKDSNKKLNIKEFSPEQVEAVKNKNEIFSNGFTINDVIEQDPKAHLIVVGLTDETRGFEESLLARALTRGMNISIEVYTQRDLPIKNIHSMYDTYIFTPPTRWTTTRFLPEALYYKKKVVLTEKAKTTLKWNIPMKLRYDDTMNYLMSIAEDDIFKKPKSKIANHLLNNW